MDKRNFDNPLRQQCMSLPELCDAQLEGVKRGLAGIPADVLRKIRRIMITASSTVQTTLITIAHPSRGNPMPRKRESCVGGTGPK